MALVVQKYGGTSLADSERVLRVADRIARARRAGHEVVAVVSAMGDETDQLEELARKVSTESHPRELDMLLTAGERITMALLAMAIADRGVEAVSLTGSQAGILTDTAHGQARIREIRGDRVRQGLQDDKVVIVAGFQGVAPDTKDVTTLGRGGSDASAVALAASLDADSCEIYTDVDGIFTADPQVVPDARKLEEISYDEMVELAASGAKVLMARSVEAARRFKVPLHVRSAFHEREGTWVKETTMEQAIVRGVAHDASEAKITVHGVPDRPGIAASLFRPIAEEGVIVDMIVQNVSTRGTTDISFTVPHNQAATARKVAEEVADDISAGGVDVDENVARVSLVGAGMNSEAGIAAKMFSTLAEEGINIEMISTSAVRISCVVKDEFAETAVRCLHDAFEPPTFVGGEAG